MRLALLALFLFLSPAAQADSVTLRETAALYAESSQKGADELSALARSDPSYWASELTGALKIKGFPTLFYFDAARLIAVFGSTKAQLDAAARSLEREADFKSWDRSQWLFICQKIASRGADARPCARRLLNEERFSISLFGGTDALGKDYALVFLLLSMEETLWNREMGDRLWAGADSPDSQSALLSALFYAVSLRNDAILVKYSDDPTRPAASRARAEALIGQMSAMEKAALPANVAKAREGMRIPSDWTEMDLRQRRREIMRQVSRSALLDLERYTFLIRAAAAPRWNQDAKRRIPPG